MFSLQDFRQREADYTKGQNVQRIRRFFNFSSKEVKEPVNLIYLQNKYAYDWRKSQQSFLHLLESRLISAASLMIK